jgi:hypothetical protein
MIENAPKESGHETRVNSVTQAVHQDSSAVMLKILALFQEFVFD